MKRLFLVTLLGFLFAGCASFSNQEENKLKNESWFDTFKSSNLAGDFPVYYMNVIRENMGENLVPEFEPRIYLNATYSGWLACFKDDTKKERYAISINGNKIVYKLSRENFINLDKACDNYKNKPDDDGLKRSEYYRQELEKLSADPQKNDLFGKYPDNPLVIIKSYMFEHLTEPLTAEYKDLNINKTYYADENHLLKFGYLLAVKINTKNKYGKSEGFQTYYFTMKDDVVIDYLKSSLDDNELINFIR